MDFDTIEKIAIGVLVIGILVISLLGAVYLQLLSLYQVPSYSFKYGNFRTYTGTKTDGTPPNSDILEIDTAQSVTYSNFYWQKYVKSAFWDVYYRAKTDLRVNLGVSGSELVETFGSWSKNFTDPAKSNATRTTIVETTWWIHRFKGYVYFTVEGSIQIQLEEYNPTWDPSQDDMEWICNTIEGWTRLKDSKVRFRIDAPDILGQESDFHGLMGMWVKTVTFQDIRDRPLRTGYGTAYISPCEQSEEITLLNEKGEPLLWGFPYGYTPNSQEVYNLAYNPTKVIPQYAYFDVNIVDLGPIPHWTMGYKGQWQYPDYDIPGVKLVFYVDVISTHHKLFTIPSYEVVETPPTAPGAYEPIVVVPSWLDFLPWIIVAVVIVVIVTVIILIYLTKK